MLGLGDPRVRKGIHQNQILLHLILVVLLQPRLSPVSAQPWLRSALAQILLVIGPI